jgi:hypothetical protein
MSFVTMTIREAAKQNAVVENCGYDPFLAEARQKALRNIPGSVNSKLYSASGNQHLSKRL